MGSVAGASHQAAVPYNLPLHLTSFVGREADLRALKSVLRSARLVTLTGTGGAGKSRLAVEAARASRDIWPDGAWWIALADATDVAPAVVASLELPGRGSPREVLASWLASRRALLVLDNCEHLIGQCASFCHFLLQRCANLTILATSREALGVEGEVRWPVSSLGDPDALNLFEVRARLVAPSFKVAPPNREPVLAICARLDRLPLAIEMAAARLDLMSERELLANLNDRFRLLASGARTAPERQQTMAAAIDWSHRLLTPEEAQLFRRLAVFQGGFTLEAARSVGANGDPLTLLNGLVQKSMVVADRLDDGSTRYRMLESHHDYALDKLRQSGEIEAIQRRHYEHFRVQRWKTREAANFWAALAWARENAPDGGLDLALEVADAGYSDQARALAVLLDQLDRPGAEPRSRARALNLAARLTSRHADYMEGRALADESVTDARRLNDPQLLAHMLTGAGLVYQAGNDLDSARGMYDEALTLLKGSANRHLAIEVQNQMAVLATEQGRFEEAREMLDQCIAFSRSRHEDALTARYLESLANAELQLGLVDVAAGHWREALSTFRDVNDPFGMIWSIGGLALVAARRGDNERALRLAAVTERMSREWSLSAWPSRIHQLEESSGQARARLGTRKAESVWNEGLSMPDARALEYSLTEGAGTAAAASAGPLSRREREVAAMVAAGMTNKQIAEKLFIAERTAEGHVERIRNKLGVRSRTEVATWAVGHGLGPAP
jgi:non-specific serine/threonine protein kinase